MCMSVCPVSGLLQRLIFCWAGDGMQDLVQASAHHAGLPAVYYMFCSGTLIESFLLFGVLASYWFFVTCSEKTLLGLSDMLTFICRDGSVDLIACVFCITMLQVPCFATPSLASRSGFRHNAFDRSLL
ncbi:TPA: hypothetical protein ACH3X3_010980 [Trebouxia sp. C0006]